MRLVGLGFSQLDGGPLGGGTTPLADLTVLIGPNDTGKSTTLGLLWHALASHEMHPPPGVPAEAPEGCLVVYVECTEGERDLLLALIADPTHDPQADSEGELAPDDDNELEQTLESFLGPRVRLRGGIDQCELDLEERFGPQEGRLLLEAMQATRLFAFQRLTDPQSHSWDVHWCLPAGHALASVASKHALEGEWPPEPSAVPLWTLGETTESVLPRPVMTPVGIDGARRELEEMIGRLSTHVRLNTETDAQDDDEIRTSYDDYGSWLVGRRDGLEVQVDPVLVSIVEAAEAAIQTRLPSFVTSAYRARLRIRPIVRWSDDGRLDIRLEPHAREVEAFDAQHAAAGLLTWIELAVAETTALLQGFVGAAEYAFMGVHEWDLEGVEPPPEVDALWKVFAAAGVAGGSVLFDEHRMLPGQVAEWAFGNLSRHEESLAHWMPRVLRRPVYLIDEPERHLQPGLQRAAARWLDDSFRQYGGQAVVATHASAFLGASESAQIVRVNRHSRNDALAPLDRSALNATHNLATEMGYDRGELLAGIAVVLYVEGAVDRVVLQELLGDELRLGRIAVSAFGGTYNLTEVLADPLLAYTTARIAVLVDNLPKREIAKLHDPSFRRERACRGGDEGAWVARLLEGASKRGRHVEVFGLKERDIFFLLDDAALRVVSRRWPGHAEAWASWSRVRQGPERLPKSGWKQHFEQRFGVAVNAATARRAAADMRERGAVPASLRDIVDSVERLGLELGAN